MAESEMRKMSHREKLSLVRLVTRKLTAREGEIKFEEWARQKYPEVRNPKKDARKEQITFDTLMGYARSGDSAAQQMIWRMREEFFKQNQDSATQGKPSKPEATPDSFLRNPETVSPEEDDLQIEAPSDWDLPEEVGSRVQKYLDDLNSQSDRWESLDKKMAKATFEHLSRFKREGDAFTPAAVEATKLRSAQRYLLEDFLGTLDDKEKKAWTQGLKGLSLRGKKMPFKPKKPERRDGPSTGMDRDVRERAWESYRSQEKSLQEQEHYSDQMLRVLRSWGVPGVGSMLTRKPEREKPDEPSPAETAMMKALAYTRAYMNQSGLDQIDVGPTRQKTKDNKTEVKEIEGMPSMSLYPSAPGSKDTQQLDAYRAFMGVLSPSSDYFPVPGGKPTQRKEQTDKPKGWQDRFRSLIKRADSQSQKCSERIVADTWVKKAISQKYVLNLQKQMQGKDLSFPNIFGTKKRLAIPLPGLNKDQTHESQLTIERLLGEHFKALGIRDTIDWESDQIVTPKSRKRVGRAISKIQSKFAKKHPEVWSAIKDRIRTQRELDKKRQLFDSFAITPLGETLEKLADLEVYYLEDPIRSMYELANAIHGKDVDLDAYTSFKVRPGEGLLNSQGRYSTPEEQAIWVDTMRSVLSLSDEEAEKANDVLADYQGKINSIREHISNLYQRARSASPEEAGKLYAEGRKEQVKANQLAAKLMRGRDARNIYEHWPTPARAALLESIERAAPGLAQKHEKADEAMSRFKDLTQKIPSEDQLESYAIFHLEKARQEYDLWKTRMNEDPYLIVSRAPIDVLRMSDHPTAPQVIRSCHSEGGSKFECAQEEAQGVGLVGYVVSKSDLDKIDLEDEEIFLDNQRNVDGIVPSARIRFRRYEDKRDGSELAIPELSIYGVQYDNLVDLATQWARSVQPSKLENPPDPQDLKNYVLTGGSYRDNTDGDLFGNFFDKGALEGVNVPHEGVPSTRQRSRLDSEEDPFAEDPFAEDEPEDSQFWEWLERTHAKIPNPNPEGRLDRVTPATLKSYSESEGPHQQRAQQMVSSYRKQFEQSKRLAQAGTDISRVANAWLRLAVSPKYISLVQEAMRDEDLPFEHIFGDRKRLAVPAPGLTRSLDTNVMSYLRVPLQHFGLMDKDADIDWLKGQVKQEGKTVKIGKLISKAQQRFAKENPKMWAAIKAKIKAGRDRAKSIRNLNTYVLDPLKAIFNTSFGDSEGHQDRLDQLQAMIQGDYESPTSTTEYDDTSELNTDSLKKVRDLLLTVLRVTDDQLSEIDTTPQRMLEGAEAWEDKANKYQKESSKIQQEQQRLLDEAKELDRKAWDIFNSLESEWGDDWWELREDPKIKDKFNKMMQYRRESKKIKNKAEELKSALSEALEKEKSTKDPEVVRLWEVYEEAKRKSGRLRRWAERSTEVLKLYSNMPEHQREALAHSVERAYGDLIQNTESFNRVNQEYDGVLNETLDNTESQLARGELKYDIQNMYALESARIKYDLWRESARDDYYLIISRSPVDVLRMSDHPTAPQKIDSCHTEGRSYFHCAVTEAQGSGLIGYVISKSDLGKIDLEADEVFEDRDRGKEGITPLSRIRFRRFERNTDSSNPALNEIALPEAKTYGGYFEGLKELARNWARSVQPDFFKEKPSMQEYTLTGGSYRDSSDGVLFNKFFGERRELESRNTQHKDKRRSKSKPKSAPVDEQGRLLMDWGDGLDYDAPARVDPQLEAFWQWVGENHPQIQNPNPEGRKDRITPATLRAYAEGDGPHATRAQGVVRSLMDTYWNLVRSQRQR